MNARLTGDPGVRWQETIARDGTFRRGLMLGTTALGIEADILRTNPALHLTFIDLSEGPLRRCVEVLGTRFPGRVDTRVADLNFLARRPPDMLGEAFRTKLCTVGDVASDAGLLAPGVAFARYRKRDA